MKNSATRILTTHVGSLARPQEIIDAMRAKESGQPPWGEEMAQQFASLIRYSVQRVVRRQVETGIDVPSDGEYAKNSFSNYVHDRLTGFEPDPSMPPTSSPYATPTATASVSSTSTSNTTAISEAPQSAPSSAPAPSPTAAKTSSGRTSTTSKQPWSASHPKKPSSPP